MSYDVSLMADTGGEPVEAWSWNHTGNTARMWREAGCDLAAFHGRPARELGDALERALVEMVADPERFRAMEPQNGWGSYRSTLAFLSAIRDACRTYPATTVEVSR
jgi:hypothetical protein